MRMNLNQTMKLVALGGINLIAILIRLILILAREAERKVRNLKKGLSVRVPEDQEGDLEKVSKKATKLKSRKQKNKKVEKNYKRSQRKFINKCQSKVQIFL